MPKDKTQKWSLNPNEVTWYGSASNSSGRNKASQSRALDVTSKEWTLVHTPTGIEVTGNIPRGHYSKNEMKSLSNKLIEALFKELERKVAKKLRIPDYA